ncbi:murein hydrolase activator EnvC family protein [Culicoidibacter larvae]|uniref:Uncharacterized protein n=1 Tax=Culicoidibacter larvae TaxID=2579976 RepID=A0A5R8QHA1_9FIRM|nr:M23 family metallopeptidase [Culicoidibacter larvae]TLG77116.1 hypothetical protein FEZ08_00425 [Culicoidibacter larvae]
MMKVRKKVEFSVLSIVLMLGVFAGISSFNPMPVAACDSAAECQAEYDRIQAEREANQQKLDGYKNDYEGITEKIRILENGISQTKEQIAVIESTITTLQNEIATLEAEIEAKHEIIRDRMSSMQLANKGNQYLDFILNASSLTDVIHRSEAVSQITGADKELIREINEKRLAVETKKAEQETKRADLTTKQADLEAQYATQDGLRAEMVSLIAAAEAHDANLEQSEQDIQNQLDEFNNGVPSTSYFSLPTPTGVVTCEFGCYSGHIGTDIGGLGYGTPILSIGNGRVLETLSGCSQGSGTSYCGGGYGNYVVVGYIVDGTSYVAMYAHLQSPAVSRGDVVSQGQTIGYSGFSGLGTGPHLHLEILKNIEYFPGDKGIRYQYVINTRDVISYPGAW